MDQASRNVHAFARREFELLPDSCRWRFLDGYLEPAGPQEKRLGFDFMEVERAALTLEDFEDLAAVKIVVDQPYFATPALWYNPDRHPLAPPRLGRCADSRRVGFGIGRKTTRLSVRFHRCFSFQWANLGPERIFG